jgi:tRNA 2-thiouridine synthesizing protein A
MCGHAGPRTGTPGRHFDRAQCAAAPTGENGVCEHVAGLAAGRRPDRRTQRNQGGLKMNFDKELDARGLSCPLPILKTKKALNDLASGQVLKVVATDPGSVKDMQAFANQTGNPLLSTAEENKDFVFFLKKK